MFSVPVGDYCGIYEFIYKYLNKNLSVKNFEYVQALIDLLNKGTSREIFEYLQKFQNILEFFEDLMIANQDFLEQDFPDGRYNDHAFIVVRNKKQQLSAILTKYYDQ